MSLAVVFFMLTPLALAIPLSLTASETMLFPPRVGPALVLRISGRPGMDGTDGRQPAIAAVSATLATIGSLAAWPIARRPFRGRGTVATILGAPLVVPAISVAVGAYLVWANMRLLGSPVTIVATHVVLTTPLVLLVVGAALLQFDETYIKAARTLGASRWTTARRVVVPKYSRRLWPHGSCVHRVIRRGGHHQLLLTAGQVPTLAVHIFNQISSSNSPVIAASSVVLALVALIAAITVSRLEDRRRPL